MINLTKVKRIESSIITFHTAIKNDMSIGIVKRCKERIIEQIDALDLKTKQVEWLASYFNLPKLYGNKESKLNQLKKLLCIEFESYIIKNI